MSRIPPLPGLQGHELIPKAGDTGSLTLSLGNRMHESRCIIKDDDLVIEVFEQSKAKERRLTKAALFSSREGTCSPS